MQGEVENQNKLAQAGIQGRKAGEAARVDLLREGLFRFSATVDKALRQSDLKFRQKLRIRFALMDLETAGELEFAVGRMMAQVNELSIDANGLFDWVNFDPEKFAALLEAILRLLEGISGIWK